jgi:hypothetical protein
MFEDVVCVQCGEPMKLAMKPKERRPPLPKGERPTMIPFAFDEFVCPNGHRRDLTYGESRLLE